MAERKETSPAGAAERSFSRGTETILVADDSRSVRGIVRAVLEDAGYRVLLAVDGEDAVARFAQQSGEIDLAVLDAIMPKKNGKDVYDELRKLRPDIRVVFMSGYAQEVISRSGILEAGFDLIIKPFQPGVLLGKVREALDRRPD